MITAPLSLYVHLPWCVRKCPYCDFNSYTAGDNAPRTRYLDALIEDLKAEADNEAARGCDRELMSVFLGGGTPSLFTPSEIARVLESVSCNFRLAATTEVSMEANPGTVECGDLAAYRQAGVNRISIGAQSFSDQSLTKLGRIHTSQDITRSLHEAHDAGLEHINIDLMYGLPDQTVTSALDDINCALALDPVHVSWYQLTLEPNTVFHARPPENLPDEDLCFEIQQHGQALLAESGFAQYEVSAYARDKMRCRHNLNYWSFGDYLAVGAGAHGKVSDMDGVRRYAKPANPLSFMNAIETAQPRESAAPLSAAELLFEFMLNALRLTDGFAEQLFATRTGLDVEHLQQAAGPAIERGLLQRRASGDWQPTPLGWRFLNELQLEFLST
ncbi:MAG: radical SAM family heme chaperone HemW [Pseudomonadales bacterium]